MNYSLLHARAKGNGWVRQDGGNIRPHFPNSTIRDGAATLRQACWVNCLGVAMCVQHDIDPASWRVVLATGYELRGLTEEQALRAALNQRPGDIEDKEEVPPPDDDHHLVSEAKDLLAASKRQATHRLTRAAADVAGIAPFGTAYETDGGVVILENAEEFIDLRTPALQPGDVVYLPHNPSRHMTVTRVYDDVVHHDDTIIRVADVYYSSRDEEMLLHITVPVAALRLVPGPKPAEPEGFGRHTAEVVVEGYAAAWMTAVRERWELFTLSFGTCDIPDDYTRERFRALAAAIEGSIAWDPKAEAVVVVVPKPTVPR